MRFLLLPVSFVYRLILAIRHLLFDLKIFKSKSYNIPIICIGNITVGGTGKTPMVEYLIRLLSDKKISVLSRGYGRETNRMLWVEYDSDSENVGDESLQIKQKFEEVNVLVSKSRRKGIVEILRKFPETDLIIMDDGYQHRWIKAGMNIILNNYEQPIYNDYLLPFGKLRDSKYSINRADIIISTKCPDIKPNLKREITENLRLLTKKNLYFSTINYQKWIALFSEKETVPLRDVDIILLTSISNADNLKNYLKSMNNKISHIKFPDHYNFNIKNIQNILSIYNNSVSDKNIILTTEKDKVKLTKFKKYFNGVRIYFVPIKTELNDSENFNKEIIKYVTENKR